MLPADLFELRAKLLLAALHYGVVPHDGRERLLDLCRAPSLLPPQALQLGNLPAAVRHRSTSQRAAGNLHIARIVKRTCSAAVKSPALSFLRKSTSSASRSRRSTSIVRYSSRIASTCRAGSVRSFPAPDDRGEKIMTRQRQKWMSFASSRGSRPILGLGCRTGRSPYYRPASEAPRGSAWPERSAPPGAASPPWRRLAPSPGEQLAPWRPPGPVGRARGSPGHHAARHNHSYCTMTTGAEGLTKRTAARPPGRLGT